jgi:hypothetical protein
LRRVPSGRSPSKRRRLGEIRGSPASSASLLHVRAGRRHCSPVHPVSPAGNPVQTHTKAPSGPVRILGPISLCALNGIHRMYTCLKAMLRSYVSAKFGTDRLIRRKRYWIANLEEKHTLSRVREPGGRLRDKNPRHRGGRGDDRWMCLDRTDKVQCGALMGAIRGAAVWTNQRAALGSPRLRVVATI